MKGGHNRVPDEVKRLRGTDQPCRTNPNAPKVEPAKVPAPPKGLSKDERAVWSELAEQVERLGTYTASDYTSFRLLVKTTSEALHPDPRDPATARVRLAQVAAGLLQRFGLDPASRGRVSVPSQEQGDGAEAFLFGKLTPIPGGKAGSGG